MNAILCRIAELRKGKALYIDTTNTDRYRIVINEQDGSKTAYYFSSPIYNDKTGKLIDLKFSNNALPKLIGSNSQVAFSDSIRMYHTEGTCYIPVSSKIDRISDMELRDGKNIILPTTNGFVYKLPFIKGEHQAFTVKTDRPFFHVRSNDKYLALMQEKFTPFVSISAIGLEDEVGCVISPLILHHKKISDCEYEIAAKANAETGAYLAVEINMYDKKLIQDTTVESANPTANNAFGTTAYLGTTVEFGEQWLYSRIDYTRMSEISGCRIKKAITYLPKLDGKMSDINAYRVSERFCSFGSTWDNKKAESNYVNSSDHSQKYIAVDITNAMVHERSKQWIATSGLIFKPPKKGDGFISVTTGDSCFLPQIVEINYY